jgi:hypothetical protein
MSVRAKIGEYQPLVFFASNRGFFYFQFLHFPQFHFLSGAEGIR